LHYFGQLEPSKQKNEKILFLFSKCQFSAPLEIGAGQGGDGAAVWNLLLFPFYFGKGSGCKRLFVVCFSFLD
jgi:hypothetical protein